MYFLAGCNVTGGIKTFLGYVSGIVASIAIMLLGGALGAVLGFWAFPIAVFAIVVPVICLEKVKWLDFVPAIFVGAYEAKVVAATKITKASATTKVPT